MWLVSTSPERRQYNQSVLGGGTLGGGAQTCGLGFLEVERTRGFGNIIAESTMRGVLLLACVALSRALSTAPATTVAALGSFRAVAARRPPMAWDTAVDASNGFESVGGTRGLLLRLEGTMGSGWAVETCDEGGQSNMLRLRGGKKGTASMGKKGTGHKAHPSYKYSMRCASCSQESGSTVTAHL